MIKNNNLTKYVLLVLSNFLILISSFCLQKEKKEKPLPSAKKIANKIIACFLIKFCRWNWDKV